MQKIIKEDFKSIHQMLDVIEHRPNNKVMKNEDASKTGTKDFTGTRSYGEAKEIFQNGYTDILDKIKMGVNSNIKAQRTENRRKVETGVVGYAPHVPNAILGLPNSMIYTHSQPQKVKAISIIYSIIENCGTEADEFIKSGICVLSAINSLELRGVRVNLNISFFNATTGSDKPQYTFATVKVKDYREHMDLQKLCFPVAHPSMFRRFGFKWIETVPELTDNGYRWGYGHHFDAKDKILQKIIKNDEVYIDLSITEKCKYNVDKLVEFIQLNAI